MQTEHVGLCNTVGRLDAAPGRNGAGQLGGNGGHSRRVSCDPNSQALGAPRPMPLPRIAEATVQPPWAGDSVPEDESEENQFSNVNEAMLAREAALWNACQSAEVFRMLAARDSRLRPSELARMLRGLEAAL